MSSTQQSMYATIALVTSIICSYVEKHGWPKAPQRPPDGTVALSLPDALNIWFAEQVEGYDLFICSCNSWFYKNYVHLMMVIDGDPVTVYLDLDSKPVSYRVLVDEFGVKGEFIKCIQEFSERKFLGES